jgi:hypothetical protein
LSSEAEARVASEAIKRDTLMALDVPNNQGVWAPHYAVLTPWCFYVFREAEAWDHPLAAIPLQVCPVFFVSRLRDCSATTPLSPSLRQSAELGKRPELVPVGKDPGRSLDHRFALSFPLGYLALGGRTPDESIAWIDAIQVAIEQAQSGRDI